MDGSLVSTIAALPSGAILVAGTGKLVSRTTFQRTLVRLELPVRLTAPLSWLLPIAEIAVGIVMVPLGGPIAATGLLLLGTLFAAAGSLAVAGHVDVECNCWGMTGRGSSLGWKQVVHLPLWIAGAVYFAVVERPPSYVTTAALGLVVASATQATRAATRLRTARSDFLATTTDRAYSVALSAGTPPAGSFARTNTMKRSPHTRGVPEPDFSR